LQDTKPNLILKNASVYTVDPDHQWAQAMAARAGITLFHDAMLDAQAIAAFKELGAEGLLKIRFRGSLLKEPDQGFENQINTWIEIVFKDTEFSTHGE
jgi:predicted amidohydrolase YtcJ